VRRPWLPEQRGAAVRLAEQEVQPDCIKARPRRRGCEPVEEETPTSPPTGRVIEVPAIRATAIRATAIRVPAIRATAIRVPAIRATMIRATMRGNGMSPWRLARPGRVRCVVPFQPVDLPGSSEGRRPIPDRGSSVPRRHQTR